jgi:hypothetical protein
MESLIIPFVSSVIVNILDSPDFIFISLPAYLTPKSLNAAF